MGIRQRGGPAERFARPLVGGLLAEDGWRSRSSGRPILSSGCPPCPGAGKLSEMKLQPGARWRVLCGGLIVGGFAVMCFWIVLWGPGESGTAPQAAPPLKAPPQLIFTEYLPPHVRIRYEAAAANNEGVRFAANGEYDRAIRCFESAVSKDEDYLPGYKNLLAAYVETERWKRAYEAACKAEGLHPLAAEIRRGSLPVPGAAVRPL